MKRKSMLHKPKTVYGPQTLTYLISGPLSMLGLNKYSDKVYLLRKILMVNVLITIVL